MHRFSQGRKNRRRGVSTRIKRIKDEATRLNQLSALRNLPPGILEVFRNEFDAHDPDGEGFIYAKSLSSIMKNLGLPNTREEVNDLIMQMDADGNGEIPFNEFAAVMATKLSFPHSIEEFRKACDMFDDNSNGKLYLSDVKFAMQELVPYPVNPDEVDYMIKHINLTNGETDIHLLCERIQKSIDALGSSDHSSARKMPKKLNVNGAPQEKRKDRAIQEISSLFGMPQKSATKVMPIKKASKKPINPLLSVLTKSIDHQRKKKGTDNVSIETGQSKG